MTFYFTTSDGRSRLFHAEVGEELTRFVSEPEAAREPETEVRPVAAPALKETA